MSGSDGVTKIAKTVILLSVLVALGLSILDKTGTRRAIAGIREPIQSEESGTAFMQIDDYRIAIFYNYSYDIEGLVLSTKDYFGWDIGSKLSPKDIALGWGKLAEYNTACDLHWTQANRWVNYWYDSGQDLSMFGGQEGIDWNLSNNHIIPADDAVKCKLLFIRRGDYVRIKGYLANVSGVSSNHSTFNWNSSTSRYDTGDGACEVIYATDIEWLP